MRACTSWAFCTQVHNKQYGLNTILAKKPIAVNMYFQSTASRDGPRCRTEQVLHKTSLVKALFDYANKQQAAPQADWEHHRLDMFSAPVWVSRSAIDVVASQVNWCDFATVQEQRVLCAVSRFISGKMPITTRYILHFERIVKKFVWSSDFASMLAGTALVTSEKLRVVAAVHEYLESTGHHLAPKVWPGEEKAWGMITVLVAVPMAACSEVTMTEVKMMVRTWFQTNQRRFRLREQCKRLINRYMAEDVD